jgi:peptide/nickel transport system ATP-binding protein
MTADGVTEVTNGTSPLLVVENLTCELWTPAGVIRPVDQVSLHIAQGESLGLVGESGSGKSMFARTVMGLLPKSAKITGRLVFNGTNLLELNGPARRKYVGSGIAMIFQDPVNSLNPVVPIGRQMTEGMRFHLGISRSEARRRAVELLASVGISEPEQRLDQYPHQISGGMRQRVTIAAALSCGPRLLIADEPTTALDVTIQRQILDLIYQLQQRQDLSVLFISHDLAVVSEVTNRIAIMYAGKVAECGPTRTIFTSARHRYSRALLSSQLTLRSDVHSQVPTIAGSPPRLTALPAGCRFAPRCTQATTECWEREPDTRYEAARTHEYACFWPSGAPGTQPDDGTVGSKVTLS